VALAAHKSLEARVAGLEADAAYTAAASAAAAAAYNAAAAAYNAAVYASSAYASSAARKKTLLRCADIVRGMYPGAPRIGGKK